MPIDYSQLTDSDIELFITQNNLRKVKPPAQSIANFVEGTRILPPDTPIPGPWRNFRTYYGVAIIDAMSPYSPYNYVDVMAAAQTVKSASVENVVSYYMKERPAPIVYASGTDKLLSKWISKRLEPLIDSMGIRDTLRAPNENTKSRSTGDTAYRKLYPGGFLEAVSMQSLSDLRADAAMIAILEEIDATPASIMADRSEGRRDHVFEARTKNFAERRRIMAVSTPTTEEESIIYDRFLLGGQHEFLVPCPLCGKHQILIRNENGTHGLRADKTAGKITKMYYICEFCHEAFFEYHKNNIFPKGRWEPMADAEEGRFSVHLSSIYGAFGLFSWKQYWQEFEKAQNTPDGMKSFMNLYDGLPSKETGTRPELKKIIQLRGGYKRGTIPDGVLYLTFGADVQRGAEKYHRMDDFEIAQEIDKLGKEGKDPIKENIPRIEMEVLGIGDNYRTWSINYHTFFGKVTNHAGGAFEKLHNFINDGGLSFEKDGKKYGVELGLIDSGDGQIYTVVYDFCAGLRNIYPCKGFGDFNKSTRTRGSKYDGISEKSVIHYKEKILPSDQTLIEVSTHYYKSIIYKNLDTSTANKVLGTGNVMFFCDFPSDYPESYFKQLQAEEKTLDGFDAGSRRNEALDCRVYALCAGEYWINRRVKLWKRKFKEKGYNDTQLEGIGQRFILDRLKEGKQI